MNLFSYSLLIVFTFSLISCEEKKTVVIKDGDTTEVKEEHTSFSKEDMKKESEEIKEKLRVWKEKAGNKTDEASVKLRNKIDSLEKERGDIVNDSTNDKAKDKWKQFKEKVKAGADTIEKKF